MPFVTSQEAKFRKWKVWQDNWSKRQVFSPFCAGYKLASDVFVLENVDKVHFCTICFLVTVYRNTHFIVHHGATSIATMSLMFPFNLHLCGPAWKIHTVSAAATCDAEPGESSHTLRGRLMILLPPDVALAHQCIHHAGCALLCCFIVITAPVVYLIHSLVLEVEWGHVGSFTGISGEWFGCSLTAALTSIREEGRIFFFLSFSITPAMPTVPSAPLDTLRHFWAAHPATMVTEEFY